MKVDKRKEKNMYFLSGSQKFNMMKNMTESLAGRVAIFELLGLSMREFLGTDFTAPFLPSKGYLAKRADTVKQYDIWEHVHKGSYPEILIERGIDWNFFYSDYIKTYIERDVYQLTKVGDELKFYRFMEMLAARIGCILNLNEVCNEVGVSYSTAERWLSILRISNIVYLLRPYSNNLIKRAIKSPKIYFLDTGLAAYLTHWETKEVIKCGAKSGDFLENFVVVEILKSYYNAGREPNNLYYYRDKDKREIDMLIERNGVLHPIEIKKSSNPDKGDCAAFAALSDKAAIGEGAIICCRDEPMPITEKVRAMPVWWI
jgi:predicted AAA+ superfamily ATPase